MISYKGKGFPQKGKQVNCFQIEVRGVTFTIWAPTLREAVETFMIDMDFFEVPKELVACEPVREFNMPDNIPAGF